MFCPSPLSRPRTTTINHHYSFSRKVAVGRVGLRPVFFPPDGATEYQLLPRSINRQVDNRVAKNYANLALSPTFRNVSSESPLLFYSHPHQAKAIYKMFWFIEKAFLVSHSEAQGLLVTDLVIVSHSKGMRTTSELATYSPNFHTTPMGGF
ncbi:hypothetical protein TNCV_2025631 [Trichonephila clavipes]|nr:hypothetical protein TNCV_2025631 [Trichonephila clavipes]